MEKFGNRQIEQQTQQQVQTLSPQQVLVVKLLQLTTVEMEERVKTEVQENPALEEYAPNEASADESGEIDDYAGGEAENEEPAGSTSSTDDYRNEDDVPDYALWDYHQGARERMEEIPFSDDTSFYENLKEQLGEQSITREQRELCEYLIGSLEDDGLLHKSLTDIADELAIYHATDTNEQELEEALRVVQSLEPAGIGARNLQECLLLQLGRKPQSELLTIETDILTKHYDDFTHKHWERIQQRLQVSKALFDSAIADITHLNPRPGISLGESVEHSRQQIVPDFLVETQGNQIMLTLNRGYVPQLRVSSVYMDMLSEQSRSATAEHREAAQFLKRKIDSAKNFIDAIKQRETTLRETMQAIINFQRPFFLEGDESLLKPMILKDIAQNTRYDISTISRVSNSKYVQTNWGVFPLKFFFSDGVETQSGEEISVREVHKYLRSLVDEEDKNKPLTDDDLTRLLREKGLPTARRTVAKYREQLHIPVARLRKQ